MAYDAVLDASALLALLHQEPGAERVETFLERAAISSVNWAEVVQKSLEGGRPPKQLRKYLEALGLEIVVFTPEDAESAGALWQSARSHGLSLADRACLATASRLHAPAMTADRKWLQVDVSVSVQVIR